MKSIFKRIGAFFGVFLALIALSATQLVGIIYYLPAGVMGGLCGWLIKEWLNSDNNYWIYALPYLGAFAGAFFAGLVAGIVYDWTDWMGGMAMTLLYALIIPIGAMLFYYGLSGNKPRILNLLHK